MEDQLNLRLLSLVVTLYEERSVTTAARKMRMSQPAFSKVLRKLRLILGDELFVKTSHGMVPTPKAHSLVGPAREVLTRLRREVLQTPAFDPGSAKTTFTFAFTEMGEMFIFPKIVAALRSLAPHTSSSSVCPNEKELLYGLESGEIDLAIGMFPELDQNKFFQQRLLKIDSVCMIRADHPIKGNSLSFRQYRELGHVAVHARGAALSLERLLRRQKSNRRIEVNTTHFVSLPEIIQRSDLVATVSRTAGVYFCSTNKSLRTVRSPYPAVQTIVQRWHARYQNDQKNQWIRKLVKSLFKQESDLEIASDR
jgi:DNA-binding transcriptional LysR family regulator